MAQQVAHRNPRRRGSGARAHFEGGNGVFMIRALHGKGTTWVSENRNGVERGKEWHCRGGAYQDEESSKPPSLPRPRREVRGERGIAPILCEKEDGEIGSVARRSLETGRKGRCLTALTKTDGALRASQACGARALLAPARGGRSTGMEDGPTSQ